MHLNLQKPESLFTQLETLCAVLEKAEQMDSTESSVSVSDFDEPLTMKRLTSLCHQCLSIMRQTDAGCRVLAGCCVCEMLRITAPNAPLSSRQLKEYFGLCLEELRRLVKERGNVKEKEGRERREKRHSREVDDGLWEKRNQGSLNMKTCLMESLNQVVDGVDMLNVRVGEIMFACLTRGNRERMTYQLAGDILRLNHLKFQNLVFEYFMQQLNEEDEEKEKKKKNLKKIEGIHLLLIELIRISDELIMAVVPHLMEEINDEDDDIRMISCRIIGRLFSEEFGSPLFSKCEDLWLRWLDRSKDKNISIRMEWVENAIQMYKNHGYLGAKVDSRVSQLINDCEEKVRKRAIECVGNLRWPNSLNIGDEVIEALILRLRDRKSNVRIEAAKSAGKLFKGQEDGSEKFKKIVQGIFETFATSDESVAKQFSSLINITLFDIPNEQQMIEISQDKISSKRNRSLVDQWSSIIEAMEDFSCLRVYLSRFKRDYQILWQILSQTDYEKEEGIEKVDEDEKIDEDENEKENDLAHKEFNNPERIEKSLMKLIKEKDLRILLNPEQPLRRIMKKREEMIERIKDEYQIEIINRMSLITLHPQTLNLLFKKNENLNFFLIVAKEIPNFLNVELFMDFKFIDILACFPVIPFNENFSNLCYSRIKDDIRRVEIEVETAKEDIKEDENIRNAKLVKKMTLVLIRMNDSRINEIFQDCLNNLNNYEMTNLIKTSNDLQINLQIIKILVYNLINSKRNRSDAQPLISIISPILSSSNSNKEFQSFQFKVAKQYLKLEKIQSFQSLIKFKHFSNLCYSSQNENFFVLISALVKSRLISPHYISLLFLYATDKDLSKRVFSFIKRLDSLKDKMALYLCVLIHLLSQNSELNFQNLQKISLFYIDLIMDASNCNFLFEMCNQIKKSRDKLNPDSTNCYIIAEMFQLNIRKKANALGFGVHAYTLPVKLPNSMFIPIEDERVAKKNLLTRFLPEDFEKKKKFKKDDKENQFSN
ncbi:hypothetical protein O9G_001820 [Rozella allomycis CSF55]|uniref:Armadillo-type fold domain-containing protein n=1 Tax=Rozella allomycis (strain CSF55) TaxID=988480 RepID=A0A075B0R6_ROZAC|nr:hypothetical protein O9G_001820 [Rozella allomycis CSF55]|eukprot:EPZ34564.1 hypothetical protein O9G_001820 [Rozella allomycis CSF55]